MSKGIEKYKKHRLFRIRKRLCGRIKLPFKGANFYEWQVGPWIFLWLHNPAYHPSPLRRHIGPLRIRWDSIWARDFKHNIFSRRLFK